MVAVRLGELLVGEGVGFAAADTFDFALDLFENLTADVGAVNKIGDHRTASANVLPYTGIERAGLVFVDRSVALPSALAQSIAWLVALSLTSTRLVTSTGLSATASTLFTTHRLLSLRDFVEGAIKHFQFVDLLLHLAQLLSHLAERIGRLLAITLATTLARLA